MRVISKNEYAKVSGAKPGAVATVVVANSVGDIAEGFFAEAGKDAAHALFDPKPQKPYVVVSSSEPKNPPHHSALHTPLDSTQAPYKPLYSPIWNL